MSATKHNRNFAKSRCNKIATINPKMLQYICLFKLVIFVKSFKVSSFAHAFHRYKNEENGRISNDSNVYLRDNH